VRLCNGVLAQAQPKKGETVLDLGCGTGEGSSPSFLWWIKRHHGGLCQITAWTKMFAQCLKPRLCFAFVEHDLTEPLTQGATYGFCTDVLEHIPTEDVDKVLDNCLALVRTFSSRFLRWMTLWAA
jgi:2-polyprenyl-3-methyl-5-hydroxy-6-metoxy-1,4-benzoquinol methylase